MPADKRDTPPSIQAPALTQDALVMMWQRQWERVPPSLYYHIQTASDINPNSSPRFESIGVTGAYEATRTMIATDYAFGICRMGYEAWQGQDDFGWNTRNPSWRKPEIFIYNPDNSSQRYTGTQSMVHADSIEWRNSGILKIDSVLNLDSDAALFQNDDESRKGGFGQGLKILLASSVASKQDRINAIRLSLDKGLSGRLTDFQARQMQSAIDNLTLALETEGEVDTYATVQAQSTDGKYYRTYCYREPFRSNNLDLWKLKYIVCELDEQKIPPDQAGQVIVAVHHPDICLGQVLETMPKNLLCVDPEFDHPRNLVREEGDARPTVEVQAVKFEADRKWGRDDHVNGNFEVQRLRRTHEDASGGVYFRRSRLLPEKNPVMNLVFDYNIDKLDDRAAKTIARSSNSTYVTGPLDTIISCATGQITQQQDWEVVLRKCEELRTQGVEISPVNWPELCPRTMRDYSSDPLAKIPETVTNMEDVKKAVSAAFMAVWPESDGYYCTREEQAEQYKLVTGKTNLKIPVITSKEMDMFLMLEGGLKPVGMELAQDFARRFNLKETGNPTIELVKKEILEEIRASKEYQQIMAGGKIGINDFLRLSVVMRDLFDVEHDGKTYFIDAPFGKHVLDLVFSGDFEINSTLRRSLTTDYPYDYMLFGRALSLAAIDSGIKFSIEDNGYFTHESTNFMTTESGHILIVTSSPQRVDANNHDGRIRIYGPQNDLLTALAYLDETIGKLYPKLIENRPGNEFQKAAETINKTLQMLSPDERVVGEPLESVKRMLEDAQKQKQEADESLKKFKGEVKRRIGGNNGVINGSQMTGKLPNGGSISGLYEAGRAFGRSSSANTYESIPRRHVDGSTRERQPGPERIVFKDADYSISLYDGIRPADIHPLEAYETVEYRDGRIVQTSEFNDLVIAEEGDGPWRTYSPNEGPSYIDRKINGVTHYDGIVEVRKDILPITNETVLPIDCLKYEIAYIQLPVRGNEEIEPPLLMEDLVNNQYHLVFADNAQEGALRFLPHGTRIYIKQRSLDEVDAERRLTRNYPEYYERLTKTIIQESKLDREAQLVLSAIKSRMPPLRREEKMKAVHDFWYRRRLYDDEGIEAETIEQLIESGVGVCAQSELAMTQMSRLVGVPCRTRVCYPDNKRSGKMAPPLHAIIEFLNDDGEWQTWDPPNSRTTDAYAKKLARNAISGNVPEIYDANSLGRSEKREVDLPKDIRSVIEKASLRKGSQVAAATADTLSRVLKGEKIDPDKIIQDLIGAVESIGDGNVSKEKKSRVTSKDIQAVLDYLSLTNLKLIALQTLYGLDSVQVQNYQDKMARDIARKLIEAMGK